MELSDLYRILPMALSIENTPSYLLQGKQNPEDTAHNEIPRRQRSYEVGMYPDGTLADTLIQNTDEISHYA